MTVTLLEQLRKRVRLDEDGFPADEDFVVLSVGDTRAVVDLVEATQLAKKSAPHFVVRKWTDIGNKATGTSEHPKDCPGCLLDRILDPALAAFTEDKP